MANQAPEACSSHVDLNFEAFLEALRKDLPPDILGDMVNGLRKRHETPPLAALESCLGRPVPLAKARQLLFYPSEEDMALYPQLVAMPPPGAPDNHPQFKAQVAAMSTLYLAHCRSWRLVKPFIEAGGLLALTAALDHPNPYLAAQVMHTLLLITDEEQVFPWHDPPATPDGRGPRSGPYALAWRRMYELSDGPFLQRLVAHHRTPQPFPDASGLALRLLAFYASWLRKNFTEDGVLRLSQGLLDELARWAEDRSEGITEDERELARQLHKDFSRFPPAQAAGGAQLGGCAEETLRLQPFDADAGDGCVVVSDRTFINHGPSQDNEAEQLAARAEAAYGRGDLTSTIHLYSAALDSLVPRERLLGEAPRRAAYHLGRAKAYMERAEKGMLREGEGRGACDSAGQLDGLDHGDAGSETRHYEVAVIDCDAALELDPAGFPLACRALLCKAQALTRLGRRAESAAAARAGVERCTGGGQLLEQLQALLAESSDAHATVTPAASPGVACSSSAGSSTAKTAAADGSPATWQPAVGTSASTPTPGGAARSEQQPEKQQRSQQQPAPLVAAAVALPATPHLPSGMVQLRGAAACGGLGGWGTMD